MLLKGLWKARTKGKPKPYLSNYRIACELRNKLPTIKYAWIPREENTVADELSTRPLRERGYRDAYVSRWRQEQDDLDERFENALAK